MLAQKCRLHACGKCHKEGAIPTGVGRPGFSVPRIVSRRPGRWPGAAQWGERVLDCNPRWYHAVLELETCVAEP
jgi:hypothetical protein